MSTNIVNELGENLLDVSRRRRGKPLTEKIGNEQRDVYDTPAVNGIHQDRLKFSNKSY